MAPDPPPPSSDLIGGPPAAASSSPIYAAWGGHHPILLRLQNRGGVIVPYFCAYKSGFLTDFSAALRDFYTATSDHLF